jgi:hypothetical protein
MALRLGGLGGSYDPYADEQAPDIPALASPFVPRGPAFAGAGGAPSRSAFLSAAPPPMPTPPAPSEYGGLMARAVNYRDPVSGRAPDEWRGVGGGPRSLAQMEQDVYARGLMNAEQDQILHGIDEAERRRGDPMRDQIAARSKDLAYERLMPEGSTSRIHAIDRGVDRYGPEEAGLGPGERRIGGLTVGEGTEIEKARERALLSESYRNSQRSDEAALQYEAAVKAMQQDAHEHPEHRADLPARLAQAERNYTRDLARFDVKNVYDYKPKVDPLASLGQE